MIGLLSSFAVKFILRRYKLEVLRWAREQDPPCPWSSETCRQAAKVGRCSLKL